MKTDLNNAIFDLCQFIQSAAHHPLFPETFPGPIAVLNSQFVESINKSSEFKREIFLFKILNLLNDLKEFDYDDDDKD